MTIDVTLTKEFIYDENRADSVCTQPMTPGEAYKELVSGSLRWCPFNVTIDELSETRIVVPIGYDEYELTTVFTGDENEMKPLVRTVAIVLAEGQAGSCLARHSKLFSDALLRRDSELRVWRSLYSKLKYEDQTKTAMLLAAVGIAPDPAISQLPLSDIADTIAMAIDSGDFDTALDLLYEQVESLASI